MNAPAAKRVRGATPDDAERVAEVHVRSWQAAYRGLLPQDYLDRLDPADRLQRWRDSLRAAGWAGGERVLVAVDEGQVCGAAWFGPARDADLDPARVGEVIGIYLLPGAWGKGLGRELMAGAVEHLTAAGHRAAVLWVLESNARARRFYARAGWAEDGAVRRSDRLGFPITEVRYRRQLPS